jgi:hypothetical protein
MCGDPKCFSHSEDGNRYHHDVDAVGQLRQAERRSRLTRQEVDPDDPDGQTEEQRDGTTQL